MKSSEFLRLVAQANRKCGYPQVAEICEKNAAVFEAEEILEEDNANT